MFGRTVKASIAVDNGRATEFIKRRNYTDKTKCYECGQASIEAEETQKKRARLSQEESAHASTSSDSKKPRIKKSAYFSDEEELSD
ncbi:hypothetical protein JOQ06_003474 [Pogonophryne albipinna]|uniref:Zinc finger CCHC-type and RNA-binding motif-containing protein 1 n=1 Tax=Pogonophryne albipinna TaxID=1090488 RepID=A0AAD6AGT8_9TELE|nr:hypothetical protein JOQ06_003474 [Pogonophryne albipinna]